MEDRYAREQAYHDARYSHETRAAAGKYYVVDASRRRYLELLDAARPRDALLEYGCGTGSAAFDLDARGVHVTGIDISPVAIEAARQRAEELGCRSASFVEMNAEALDVPDASVDVVCGTGILHHLDISAALAEVRRVLKPGGWAVFSEPLGTNPLINLYRRLTPKMRTEDEHPLVDADFERLGEQFRSHTVEPFNLLSLAGAPFARWPAGAGLVTALQRADRWLFRHVRPARRLAWVVVIRLEA